MKHTRCEFILYNTHTHTHTHITHTHTHNTHTHTHSHTHITKNKAEACNGNQGWVGKASMYYIHRVYIWLAALCEP